MKQENHPLVSIIVPCCNKARWVADCLWSIVCQTYRPIEAIVCDNGSVDRSINLIHPFEEIPWIRCVYYEEPLGIGRGFNVPMEAAKGEYIALLDADDTYRSWHLEKLMKAMESHPDADITYGDFEMLDVFGNVTKKICTKDEYQHIFTRCSIPHATGITKRSVYEEIGGYHESMQVAVDWEFVLRAIWMNKKIVYIGETGYQWRIVYKGDQVTVKHNIKSKVRFESHSYIHRTYNLPGPCRCGCGAMP